MVKTIARRLVGGLARLLGGLLALALLASALLILYTTTADFRSRLRSGRWRTTERTLLLLGLAGGWPGGLVAQKLLRHKSVKASFRSAFWGTVFVNVAVFVLMHSPLMSRWRP